MRHLRRPQYTVPTMLDTGRGGRRRQGDRSHYERTAAVRVPFPPHWTEPDVKGLLHAMQGSICAYCGLEVGLDVDHFRPKGAIDEDPAHGGYWWLAYECSNYFLACTTCNRNRKKASFPILPFTARCTYQTRGTIRAEKRILLDPSEDPIEEWLTLGQGDETGKLIPNADLSTEERSRVQEAIDLFGLNSDQMVRGQRSKAYERAARAAAEQRWDELRLSAMCHRPHSLAARIVLERVAPECLPTAEEEMRDLIDLLWKDLRTLVDEIRSFRARARAPSPVDERQLRELVWALIVLRSDPPAGDPSSADEYLGQLLEREEAEIRTAIAALFRAMQRALAEVSGHHGK
jgi:uncharacterized protein (TIGR02646 family)